MLSKRPGDYSRPDTLARSDQKEVKIFITFLFLIFFFTIGRSAVLGEPSDSYEVMVTTILVMMWYGLTMLMS